MNCFNFILFWCCCCCVSERGDLLNSEVSVYSLNIISWYVLLCVNGGIFITSMSEVDMDVCWEDYGEEEGDGECSG